MFAPTPSISTNMFVGAVSSPSHVLARAVRSVWFYMFAVCEETFVCSLQGYFVCSVPIFCLRCAKFFCVCRVRGFFWVGALTFCLQCGGLFCLQCGDLFCLKRADLFCLKRGIVFYVTSQNLFCLQCILFCEMSNFL